MRKHRGHRNEETGRLFNTANFHKCFKMHSRISVKGLSYFGSMSEYVISGSDCGNVFFWTGPNFMPFSKVLGDNIGAVIALD